jgi:hypothetical protein
MRLPALCLALAAALAGCGSEENTVLSGYPPAVISPVRSSLSAAVTFTDATGPHLQWVVAMADVPDLCTKLTAHRDYFQNPIENFVAAVVWVPPGQSGTFFVGQAGVGNEVLIGVGPAGGAAPQLVRLPGASVNGFLANIGLSQFDVGPGGEARGSFDVLVSDPTGRAREYVGRFKATYCPGAEQAQLP